MTIFYVRVVSDATRADVVHTTHGPVSGISSAWVDACLHRAVAYDQQQQQPPQGKTPTCHTELVNGGAHAAHYMHLDDAHLLCLASGSTNTATAEAFFRALHRLLFHTAAKPPLSSAQLLRQPLVLATQARQERDAQVHALIDLYNSHTTGVKFAARSQALAHFSVELKLY
jgi:hypothetical protein